jgi:hypothetical protein
LPQSSRQILIWWLRSVKPKRRILMPCAALYATKVEEHSIDHLVAQFVFFDGPGRRETGAGITLSSSAGMSALVVFCVPMG